MADGETDVVRALDAAELRARRNELVELIADAVDGGASVGYLLPHSTTDYVRLWDDVAQAVAGGECAVLVCERDGRFVGTVQLAPCGKPNVAVSISTRRWLDTNRRRSNPP
ncbi:MAG: hypothetical protein ABI569_16565, partial [Casimicrobiaceae bacterium]